MVANKVEKLLVTNGTAASDVASLASGNYVALVQGKAENTPIELSDKFQFVVKKLNGLLEYSDVIKAKDIVSVEINPYRAPVAQVVTVTLPEDPLVGNTYTLYIVDKADKELLQRRQDKQTYILRAVEGETAASLGDKFRSLINGLNNHSTVIASGTGGTLVLTAKSDPTDAAGIIGLQHYFEASLVQTDALGNSSIVGTLADTAKVDFGNGTYEKLKDLERFTQGYDGYLNRTKFPVELYPSDLVQGGTYDTVVIAYNNQYQTNSTVFGERVSDPIEIVIAVEAGKTGDLETLLDEFL